VYVDKMSAFDQLESKNRFPAPLSGAFSPYLDYGFAVLKLRAGRNVRVQPMALEFETRHPRQLYFPTYQFHTTEIAATSRYDTVLFCQRAEQAGFDETRAVVDTFMNMEELDGLFIPNRLVQRHAINGEAPNQHTLVTID
jgi:hypothetical protein